MTPESRVQPQNREYGLQTRKGLLGPGPCFLVPQPAVGRLRKDLRSTKATLQDSLYKPLARALSTLENHLAELSPRPSRLTTGHPILQLRVPL